MQSEVKQRLIEFLAYLGISQKTFADRVGLSSGFVNSIRVSIQPKTLDKISAVYPELNTGWLITGEGEMLRSAVTQNVGEIHGDAQGVNVNGSVTIGTTCVDKFLEEIAAQRRMTERYMDQMDRLITVYEKLMEGRK